jgi:hypothetical protein
MKERGGGVFFYLRANNDDSNVRCFGGGHSFVEP